jgi:hypothetical protein
MSLDRTADCSLTIDFTTCLNERQRVNLRAVQHISRRRVAAFIVALSFVALLFAVAGAAEKPAQGVSNPEVSGDTLALLAPDSTNVADPQVTVWLDAASEEGLHAVAIHDSDFLAGKRHYAGIILPDQLHTIASDELIAGIQHYVESGGNLMLVFDAGKLTSRGTYARPKSRLSQLAGVDYALYDAFRDTTIRRAALWGTAEVMAALEIPPGKFVPAEPELVASGQKELAVKVALHAYFTLDTYTYGHIQYASFVTQGSYAGQELLQSTTGLVAGMQRRGTGSVLFVNLPLGYLGLRTDGLLLHGFLHYFAERIGLPYLAGVPDGLGGLVLNWHLDSNAVEPVMPLLEKIGFFQQGPYSFHLTAGPDRDKPGDGLGMDIRNNSVMQQWVHVMEQHGTIGDHGGWIHNYFGLNVSEDNEADFTKYLELNNQALEAVTGHAIREYSAPVGTHPKWVTRWLEAHGFLAYYFTGDTGMAPTKVYRDGVRTDNTIWAFPICNLGKAASLEDMHFSGVPENDVAAWLRGMSEFVSRERVSRLVYAHPPGAAFYPEALRSWLEKTKELKQRGAFRWYTMTEMAQFLTSRQQVQWQMSRSKNSEMVIRASHATSLAHQTWFLPKNAYERPRILEGKAAVQEDAQRWMVVADNGTSLVFAARPSAGSR